jgi:hypothetical protein
LKAALPKTEAGQASFTIYINFYFHLHLNFVSQKKDVEKRGVGAGNEALIVKVKVKVKFTLEQATKSQKGSRGITVLFL